VAVREWGRSKELGSHPHIVELKQLFVHTDHDQAIQGCITASFRNTNGAQECQPEWFPSAYLCMTSEYMDSGSVSSLMDQKLLTLEGVCAVARQVASALAFMHDAGCNHNEVRPENILLKRSHQAGVLHVKLADLGDVERSANHIRDREELAYTVWCMTVGKAFSFCPSRKARPALMGEFQKALLLGQRATEKGRALIETVVGLWNDRLDMVQVACKAEFVDCEVREPEVAETRSQLAACANLEVADRARATWERLQCARYKLPLGSAKLEEIDADQMAALAALDEGSITVRDSRDASSVASDGTM